VSELLIAKTYIARCVNPLKKSIDDYLSICLLSSEDGKNIRDPLNLLICLDISGSMKYTIDYN